MVISFENFAQQSASSSRDRGFWVRNISRAGLLLLTLASIVGGYLAVIDDNLSIIIVILTCMYVIIKLPLMFVMFKRVRERQRSVLILKLVRSSDFEFL